jgi:hypothetical protein
MFDHLDKLRAKSPAMKKQIAFSISGVATLMVALLWWGSFFGPEIASKASESMTISEALSPAEGILASLKAATHITTDGIKKIAAQATASTTTTSTTSEEENVIEAETMGDMRKAAERNTEAYTAPTSTSASPSIPATTTWR